MDPLLWPILLGAAIPAVVKALDVLLERREARRKEQASGQREDRKTAWERLDQLDAKYDALREKYDALTDQSAAIEAERDAANKERDHFRQHYDRMVNAVQWLILDNEDMMRKLNLVPTYKYRDLTGEFLGGGDNPNG